MDFSNTKHTFFSLGDPSRTDTDPTNTGNGPTTTGDSGDITSTDITSTLTSSSDSTPLIPSSPPSLTPSSVTATSGSASSPTIDVNPLAPTSTSSTSSSIIISSTPIVSVTSSATTNPPADTSSPAINTTDGRAVLSTSFTTIVTEVNGVSITTVSPIPTTHLNPVDAASPSSHRTGVIVGTTTAFLALILIALGAIFAWRKRKQRSSHLRSNSADDNGMFAERFGGRGLRDAAGQSGGGAGARKSIANHGWRGRREKGGLLDGEEFYDDPVEAPERNIMPMRTYGGGERGSYAEIQAASAHSPSGSVSHPYANPSLAFLSTGSSSPPEEPSHPYSAGGGHPYAHSLTPSSASTMAPPLFRARTSDTGSIFRESGLWPPPASSGEKFEDPFVESVRGKGLGGELEGVVLGVMGPARGSETSLLSTSRRNTADTTLSDNFRDSRRNTEDSGYFGGTSSNANYATTSAGSPKTVMFSTSPTKGNFATSPSTTMQAPPNFNLPLSLDTQPLSMDWDVAPSKNNTVGHADKYTSFMTMSESSGAAANSGHGREGTGDSNSSSVAFRDGSGGVDRDPFRDASRPGSSASGTFNSTLPNLNSRPPSILQQPYTNPARESTISIFSSGGAFRPISQLPSPGSTVPVAPVPIAGAGQGASGGYGRTFHMPINDGDRSAAMYDGEADERGKGNEQPPFVVMKSSGTPVEAQKKAAYFVLSDEPVRLGEQSDPQQRYFGSEDPKYGHASAESYSNLNTPQPQTQRESLNFIDITATSRSGDSDGDDRRPPPTQSVPTSPSEQSPRALSPRSSLAVSMNTNSLRSHTPSESMSADSGPPMTRANTTTTFGGPMATSFHAPLFASVVTGSPPSSPLLATSQGQGQFQAFPTSPISPSSPTSTNYTNSNPPPSYHVPPPLPDPPLPALPPPNYLPPGAGAPMIPGGSPVLMAIPLPQMPKSRSPTPSLRSQAQPLPSSSPETVSSTALVQPLSFLPSPNSTTTQFVALPTLGYTQGSFNLQNQQPQNAALSSAHQMRRPSPLAGGMAGDSPGPSRHGGRESKDLSSGGGEWFGKKPR